MEENKFNAYLDICYLIGRYLTNNDYDNNRLIPMDFDIIFNLSKHHFVDALIGSALKESGYIENLKEELKEKTLDSYSSAVRRTILFEKERNEIFSLFEKKNIWYLPLKGINLSKLYKEYGIRQFADNDIFFDKSKQKEVVEIMTNLGYKITSLNKGHHDSYSKKPIFNFEMHRSLLPNDRKINSSYYSNLKEKLIKDKENNCGYHFKEEDEYIFNIIHGYKHYIGAGTGLRFLADVFVLNNRKEQLDYDYIKLELGKLNILDFETGVRTLANKLFGLIKPNLSKEEKELFEIFCQSGVYGTLEINAKNTFKRNGNSKAKYIWKRIWPGYKWCKSFYPFFAYTIIFIPILILYRVIKAATVKRKTAFKELKYIKKISKK